MTDSDESLDETRRKYMKALGAAGLLGASGLAGCVGGDGGGGGTTSAAADTPTEEDATSAGDDGTSQPETEDGVTVGTTAPAGTNTPGGGNKGLIGVAMKSLSSFFFRTAATATEYEAQQLGYDANVVGAGMASSQLNRRINNLAARSGTAALVTDPVNSQAQQAPISSTMDQGIPVGVVDTPPADEATVTVAFDNYVAGENLANKCVEQLRQKYGSLDGRHVVYFHGFLGSFAWNQRAKGTRDRMEEVASNTGLTYHHVQGGGSPEEFATSASEWFPQHQNEVDAVLNASSGGFLAGVLQAMDRLDLLYYRGNEEHILVGAVDGYLSDVEWMQEGYIDFISMQNPVAYGQICVDLLDEYAIGEGAEGVVPIGESPEVVRPNRFYFGEVLGETPQIEETDYGPRYTVPTYIMGPGNVGNPLHWPKLAVDRLGMESEAASLGLSPQGSTPPEPTTSLSTITQATASGSTGNESTGNESTTTE